MKERVPGCFLDPLGSSYGYRGRDCRANLYFLPTGEAVYFIARVVVLYHVKNRTQRHYRKHTECVRWSVSQETSRLSVQQPPQLERGTVSHLHFRTHNSISHNNNLLTRCNREWTSFLFLLMAPINDGPKIVLDLKTGLETRLKTG